MFSTTQYRIDAELLEEAIANIPNIDFRVELNKPTGNFFYDAWEIKDEYENSVWKKIIDTLPFPKGEARLIKLDPGTCYRSHADIDDRWHLSIVGEKSYLIDLENDQLYPTEIDCKWHIIDTSLRHSAANFGSKPRIQLVVRKLLDRCVLLNGIEISITLKKIIDDRRYVFDDMVSPLLNRLSKQNKMSDFRYEEFEVKMRIDELELQNFSQSIESHFNVRIV
jgi:hypothetical protein